MDFENMMITPAIYQDIPSSFMMNPMMMPMMPMYGMYPSYGITTMRPALPNDKFEKLQAKKRETQKTAKNTSLILGALAVGGWILSKRVKIKNPQLAAKVNEHIKTGYSKTKNFFATGFNKVKNLFKKPKTNP